MVGIPAGGFVMGSPAGEPGRFDSEGPQHHVSIRAFALAKYDVTSAEFLKFLKETGYQPKPCDPITDMRWHSPGNGMAYRALALVDRAAALAGSLSRLEGRASLYRVAERKGEAASDRRSQAARGPIACRQKRSGNMPRAAARRRARWWGDALGHGNANCNGCGSQWDYNTLADVDAFASNPFGLYGMLGNAWQWTEDCWHPSYVGAPSDGSAWTEQGCDRHVLRGGSWDNLPVFVRSAARNGAGIDGKEYDYSSLAGFRVARNLP